MKKIAKKSVLEKSGLIPYECLGRCGRVSWHTRKNKFKCPICDGKLRLRKKKTED